MVWVEWHATPPNKPPQPPSSPTPPPPSPHPVRPRARTHAHTEIKLSSDLSAYVLSFIDPVDLFGTS